MPSILQRVLIGAGVLNPSEGKPGGAPLRGEGNGVHQTKEVIAAVVKSMAEPPSPSQMLGQVVAAPTTIQKSNIMNFFTTDFFGDSSTAPGESEADVQPYMKVYVRIPEEHSCLPITRSLADVMAQMSDDESFVDSLRSGIGDWAITQLYPYFLMPVGEDNLSFAPPKVGDIVSVKFTDTLRTQGVFERVVERIQALTDQERASARGGSSSSENFDDLFTPIDTVALSQGPGALSEEQADALGTVAGSQNLPCCVFVTIWVLTQRGLVPSNTKSVDAWAAMAPSTAWWGAANIYDAKKVWSNIAAYKAALGGTEITVEPDESAPNLEVGRWHIVQKWCWSSSPVVNSCQTCQSPSPGSGHTYLVYANSNGSFRIMDSSSSRGFRDKIDSWFEPGCEYRVLTLPMESSPGESTEEELNYDIYGESAP